MTETETPEPEPTVEETAEEVPPFPDEVIGLPRYEDDHIATMGSYAEWGDPDAVVFNVSYVDYSYDLGSGSREDEVLDESWYCSKVAANDSRSCNTPVAQGGTLSFIGPTDEELMEFAEDFFASWGWDQAVPDSP